MAVVDNFSVKDLGDDVAEATATVDGVTTTVQCWKSHLEWIVANTPGTVVQKRTAVRQFLAQRLKAKAQPPAAPTIDVGAGSVTV